MASREGWRRPFSCGAQPAAAILILFVVVFPAPASGDCFDHLSVSNDVVFGGVSDSIILVADVSELTSEGAQLYFLSVDEAVTTSLPTEEEFIKYFLVNTVDTLNLTFEVRKSLLGLPDYPDVQDEIFGKLSFSGFSDGIECTISISHKIKDENSQKPILDQGSYNVTIREDYPPSLQLLGVEVTVRDRDGTEPNNMFSVIVSECPLKATEEKYQVTEGQPVRVYFELTSQLDFETSSTDTCTVTAKDYGVPPLISQATIHIAVTDMPDEPPKFTSDFYFAEVTVSVPDGDPLATSPGPIHAEDGDKDILSTIMYALKDGRPDAPGTDYFTINTKDGSVTLTRELDAAILVFERISFLITAQDESGAETRVNLEVGLPWSTNLNGDLHFEQYKYATEVLKPLQEEVVLKVKAVTEESNTVNYTLREEDENFAMDAITGEITTKVEYVIPASYHLVAVATVTGTNLRTETQVTIVVLESSSGSLTMIKSLLRETVLEGNGVEEEVAVIQTSGPTQTMCIAGVQPVAAAGMFRVDLVGSEWRLKKVAALNYEDTREIQLKLSAFEDKVPCTQTDTSDTELLRNEALVIISVKDMNDEEPKFVVPSGSSTVVAYPEDVALQKVVGPVITIQADDVDTVGLVRYSLDEASSGSFTVEEETGDVYPKGDFACSPSCDLSVTANDGNNEIEGKMKVLSLKTENIFTVTLDNLEVSQVDEALNKLSQDTGVQFSKVYVSPNIGEGPDNAFRRPSQVPRTLGDAKATTMSLQVHLYGIDAEGNLMTLDSVNKALSNGNTDLEAEEFADEGLFHGDGGSDTGLTVAVGILGSLLGVILLAGVGFLVYNKSQERKTGQKGHTSPINTLGKAYGNLSYIEENEGSDSWTGSIGGKRDIPMNGLTVELPKPPAYRDSPPLFRSGLHPKKDSPTSASRTEQKQYRGLRRTDPGEPEYYGTSSPEPPSAYVNVNPPTTSAPPSAAPSFSGPSSSGIYALPSTSSDASQPQPIYAQVVKPAKRDLPPTPAAAGGPPKSIFRDPPPNSEDVPRIGFSSIGTAQVDEPDADYEDGEAPKSSRFLALKGSPPPRKSSSARLQDDDVEDDSSNDGGSGIMYPGGKKSNLKQDDSEGQDDDGKKSVAFKVLVDTKEIEAENEGPSQKAAAAKSDALDILEANKKKLESGAFDDEDDDDDDDDDENNVKL